MSFSANGEFLATTHVDNLGVFLWVNRGLYADVTVKPIAAGTKAFCFLSAPSGHSAGLLACLAVWLACLAVWLAVGLAGCLAVWLTAISLPLLSLLPLLLFPVSARRPP